MSIPLVELNIEFYATSPPKPIGLTVRDEKGRVVGIVSLPVFESVLERLREMQRVHKEEMDGA